MIALMPHAGFLSETSRLQGIAQALRRRGAEVVIASHGGPYAHLLGTAGTDWIQLEPAWDSTADQSRFLDGLLSWGSTDRDLYDDRELRASVEAETAFLRDVDADLVHIGFTLSAYLSSRASQTPLSTSHVGAFVDPVLLAGLAPVPVNPQRRDLTRLPSALQRRAVNVVPRLLNRPAAQLNRIAAELGLPPIAGLMGLMSGDLVLVTELPEVLGLPRASVEHWRSDWTTRRRREVTYRCTGPLFAKLDVSISPEVEDFLANRSDVVLVSLSSATPGLVRKVVDSVRAAGAPVLVAATVHDLHDLQAEDVCVAGILPNHLVMPRVAACVIMGGQGSVQTALASGTPFVGLPLHAEQELNTAVAERLGACIRMSPASAATPELATAVRALLDDMRFTSAAGRVAELYATVDGADLAADAMLEFLSHHR